MRPTLSLQRGALLLALSACATTPAPGASMTAAANLPTNTSAPRTPEALISRFGEYVHRRDLDSLIELYEPEATFIPAPGVTHTGHAAIREALGAMLALAPTMTTHVDEVHAADQLALVIVTWSLRGTAPDGTAVTQQGKSADVLRRQADGTWRVLIDHP